MIITCENCKMVLESTNHDHVRYEDGEIPYCICGFPLQSLLEKHFVYETILNWAPEEILELVGFSEKLLIHKS